MTDSATTNPAVKSIGATVLAVLLLRLRFVRAIPLFLIGLAVSLLKPLLLVLGVVKAIGLCRSRCDGTSSHATTKP